jgi:hypothetical protein
MDIKNKIAKIEEYYWSRGVGRKFNALIYGDKGCGKDEKNDLMNKGMARGAGAGAKSPLGSEEIGQGIKLAFDHYQSMF